jgi:hypothetical protein
MQKSIKLLTKIKDLNFFINICNETTSTYVYIIYRMSSTAIRLYKYEDWGDKTEENLNRGYGITVGCYIYLEHLEHEVLFSFSVLILTPPEHPAQIS